MWSGEKGDEVVQHLGSGDVAIVPAHADDEAVHLHQVGSPLRLAVDGNVVCLPHGQGLGGLAPEVPHGEVGQVADGRQVVTGQTVVQRDRDGVADAG